MNLSEFLEMMQTVFLGTLLYVVAEILGYLRGVGKNDE